MKSFVIEIHPKKIAFDPLASYVKRELMETGEPPATATVETRRLYRIEGNFLPEDVQRIASTLLVDPVIETAEIEEGRFNEGKTKKGKKVINGWVLDIWPKKGVTDPVGETVLKGLRDLGFSGSLKAASAQRYVFKKLNDAHRLRTLAKRVLANELIHDIHVRKPD